MIKKLRIVFSGIENSGKSTLSRAVASELGFEFTDDPAQNPYDAWFTGVSPEEYAGTKADARGEV